MKERVINVSPGDIIHILGQAGPDGFMWSYTSDDTPGVETVFQAQAGYMRFEMVLRLQDGGNSRRGRLTEWARRVLMGARS